MAMLSYGNNEFNKALVQLFTPAILVKQEEPRSIKILN